MALKKNAYITVETRNPFGESADDRVYNDPGFSASFVPGYSDKRHENELLKVDGHSGEVKPLKHRFHWARSRNMTNTANDGTRMLHWKRQGYRVVGYQEAIDMGYNLAENPAIEPGEDGNAHWMEYTLTVCDAPTAAANWNRVQKRGEEAKARSKFEVEEVPGRLATTAAKSKGASANFEFVGDSDS